MVIFLTNGALECRHIVHRERTFAPTLGGFRMQTSPNLVQMIVHRVSACGVEYACSLRRAASYEIRGQKLAVALIRDSTPGRGVNE